MTYGIEKSIEKEIITFCTNNNITLIINKKCKTKVLKT